MKFCGKVSDSQEWVDAKNFMEYEKKTSDHSNHNTKNRTQTTQSNRKPNDSNNPKEILDIHQTYSDTFCNKEGNKTTRKIKNKNSMRGLCKLNGVMCEYLFDTGASISLIDWHTFRRLEKAGSSKIEKSDHEIMSASEEFIAHGKTRLTVAIGDFEYTGEVLVAKNGAQGTMLMGRDIINKCPFFQTDMENIQDTIERNTTTLLFEAYKQDMDMTDVATLCSLFEPKEIVSAMEIEVTRDVYLEAEEKVKELFKTCSAEKYSELTPSSKALHKIELVDPAMQPIRSKTRRVPCCCLLGVDF